MLLIGQIAVLDGFIILCKIGPILAKAMNGIVFFWFFSVWKIANCLLQPFSAFKIGFGHRFDSNLIPEESALEMNK